MSRSRRWSPGALCAGALMLCVLAGAAQADDTAAYDRLFDQALQRYQLPGLAVGVIQEGRVVYRRTA
ncbi:MAG TPA: penicillin-binding protein, partial [Stenotrophomonas sp.]